MKILLAGEGGQGVQIVGQLLTQACFLEKKPSLYIPNFGVEQRGGVSLSFVVEGEDASYPQFEKADLLVIFCDRAYERVIKHLGPETKIITGPAVTPGLVKKATPVSAANFAPQLHNIIILGKILKMTQLADLNTIKKAMDERLGHHFKKNPALRDLDFRALESGYGL